MLLTLILQLKTIILLPEFLTVSVYIFFFENRITLLQRSTWQHCLLDMLLQSLSVRKYGNDNLLILPAVSFYKINLQGYWVKYQQLTCVYTRGTQTVSQPIKEPNLRLMSDNSVSSVCTMWSLVMSDSFRALFIMFVAQTNGIQYLDMGVFASISSKIFLSLSIIRPTTLSFQQG